jgi:hypothetical protein
MFELSNKDLGIMSVTLQAAGAGLSAVNAFYSVKSAKYQARSQALDLQFQATMAGMNARQAEQQAQGLLYAGNQEIAARTMQYAQAQASERTRQGASGATVGVGSSAELSRSIEYAKDVDRYTISANSIRAANAARMQKTNLLAQQSILGTQARSLLRTSGASSAAGTAFGTLLGASAGAVGNYATMRHLGVF